MTIRNEINIETRTEYELSSSEPVHVDIKREPNDPRGTRTIMTTRGSKPPRHICIKLKRLRELQSSKYHYNI